jgi:hypothetical protein
MGDILPRRWFFGSKPRIPVRGAEGFVVHVGSSIHETVVFLGFSDPSIPSGIKCEGTGFLLHYDGCGYLITARHVAETLSNIPFKIRVNRSSGGADLLDGENVQWYHHQDDTVDLSAISMNLTIGRGYECLYLTDDMLLTRERRDRYHVDVGDFCYTLGPFHFISGRQRNLPFIYAGNVALLPPAGERIPVWDERTRTTQQVEAYLIESRAINGASGSPVLVRPSLDLAGYQEPAPLAAVKTLFLLGGFSSGLDAAA